MRPADNINKLIGKLHLRASAELDNRVHDDITRALAETEKAKSARPIPNIWRKIMKNKMTKLAAAAVIIIAVALSVNIFHKSIPTASAAEVFAEAAKAVANLYSINIKARIRDLPQDNFQHIELEHDFVPFEMWKTTDDIGVLKWRIEKPLRVAVMDGEYATLLIQNMFACSGRCPDFQCYDCDWCGQLLDVEGLLESALKQAQESPNTDVCMWNESINGRDKIVIDIETKAVGGLENDYLKNKFLSTANTKSIYTFDSETKLLEAFSIYVHTEESDVLVFEITDIEYNPELDESLFVLELPEDVVWLNDVEILENNEKYEQMSPKETAEIFFQACADEDWAEAVKFDTMFAAEEIQEMFGGLEIISIGEPFQSGFSSAWFVPYEIKLKNGQVRKHNLALKKDKEANRYFIDGGL